MLTYLLLLTPFLKHESSVAKVFKNAGNFQLVLSTVPESHLPEGGSKSPLIGAEQPVIPPITKQIHLGSTLAEQIAAQASLKTYLILKLSLRLF